MLGAWENDRGEKGVSYSPVVYDVIYEWSHRYDPRKFSTSRSIVTYIPHDRNLGNVISAYLILLWINLEHGYNIYVDKASHNQLKLYFKNVEQTPVKILEEGLCDWDEFGFQKFEVFENLDYPTLDLTQQKNYVLFSANMCTEDFFHLNEK